MTGVVRSTRLGVLITPASERVNLYVVPVGWRAILKDITYSNNASAASSIEVNAFTGAGRADLVRQSLAQNALGHWTGWVVMNPSDTISVFADQASIAFWASGTLLKLTGAEAPGS